MTEAEQQDDLNEIKTLLKKHKTVIEPEKYQFIKAFIISPLEKGQKSELSQNDCQDDDREAKECVIQ